jgi:hypothetical protein
MSQRLYLVPEDVVESWRSNQRMQQMDSPRRAVITNIDRGMSKSLNSPGVSDREKMVSHGQNLASLLTHRASSGRRPPVVAAPSPPRPPSPPPQAVLEQQALEHVPSRLQARAKRLRDALIVDPNIQWDSGNTLYIRGQKIEGSNVSDLLHDAVRSHPASAAPSGSSDLRSYLQAAQIPKSYFYNRQWKTSGSVLKTPLAADDPAVISVNTPPKTRGAEGMGHPAYKKAPIPISWDSLDDFHTPRAAPPRHDQIKSWVGIRQ